MEIAMTTMQDLMDHLEKCGDVGLELVLPSGQAMPAHFHVTEVGRVRKNFVDCGGTPRETEACVLQVWVATDVDHRLTASKLLKILKIGETLFPKKDIPVDFEVDLGTVSILALQDITSATGDTNGVARLVLGRKHTECLAPDRCGVPTGVGLQVLSSGCGPGCC
jgi:hypothetical protein